VIKLGPGVDYIPPGERQGRRRRPAMGAPLVFQHGNLRITHMGMGDVVSEAQAAAEDAAAQKQVGMMLKLLAKGQALPATVTGAELSAFLSDVITFGEKAAEMPWFARLTGTATKETNLHNALADAYKVRDSISVSWFGPDSYSKGSDPYDAAMKVAQRIYQEGVGAAATKAVVVKAQKQLEKDLSKPLDPNSAFTAALTAFWKAHRVAIITGGVVLGGLFAAPYIARGLKGARAVRSIARGG
jgi:hypothetical protein